MPVTTNGAENKQGKGEEEEKGVSASQKEGDRGEEEEENRAATWARQQPVYYCHCPKIERSLV